MISLSQIRTLFSKKQSAHTAEPLRVERIWSIELMLAAVLLVATIGFDVWVYQKLAAPAGVPEGGHMSGVATLDKEKIMALTKTFEANENFLKAPTFPLIGNPF